MVRNIKSKIYKRNKLVKVLKSLRDSGKTIGLTNGTFDLLHVGHVVYLEEAKKTCDVLVVSVNSDNSVKTYKDFGRPITPQIDRAKVIASLESVDYVTFHNERRMLTTLKLLEPHYYIKAGDYKITDLTSRKILKEWGGKVKIIPAFFGKSTSKIIRKIIDIYKSTPVELEQKIQTKPLRAIILDRDGVINEEVEYLHEPEKFKFIPGAIEGLKKIQNMKFKIIIITTQAGIGLGYFTKEDFFRVNKVMLSGFKKHGIIISKIYFCPHSIDNDCECRKPKIGLLTKAEKDLNLNLKKSWVIGDKTADILAGRTVGCKTILVKTGHAGYDQEFNTKPDFIAVNLKEAVEIIKKLDD